MAHRWSPSVSWISLTRHGGGNGGIFKQRPDVGFEKYREGLGCYRKCLNKRNIVLLTCFTSSVFVITKRSVLPGRRNKAFKAKKNRTFHVIRAGKKTSSELLLQYSQIDIQHHPARPCNVVVEVATPTCRMQLVAWTTMYINQ